MATNNPWASARAKRYDVTCGCGVTFQTNSTQAKYCPRCRHSRANLAAVTSKRRRRKNGLSDQGDVLKRLKLRKDSRSFKVAYDPTGDFQVGAVMGALDLFYSLELAVLPLGFALQDVRTQSLNIVIAREDGGRTLAVLTPQELVG